MNIYDEIEAYNEPESRPASDSVDELLRMEEEERLMRFLDFCGCVAAFALFLVLIWVAVQIGSAMAVADYLRGVE